MLNHGALLPTDQAHAAVVARTSTERAESKKPRCAVGCSKAASQVITACVTGSTCRSSVRLQLELCRIRLPVRGGPRLSAVLYGMEPPPEYAAPVATVSHGLSDSTVA